MKKILLKLSLIVVAVLLIFTSCNEPEEFDNVLIGSWKYIDYQTGDWEKIVFKEALDFNLINYSAYTTSTTTIIGTYTFTDTTYTLKIGITNPRYVVFKYLVSGNSLTVHPGKTYMRQ